jgi:hypothetical protein
MTPFAAGVCVSKAVRILTVPEFVVENLHPGLGALEIRRIARGFVKRKRGAAHLGVIVGEARMLTLPVTVRVEEPVTVAQFVRDESESALRGVDPGLLLEDRSRVRQRSDHHAVPVGQDFVVTLGRDSFLPRGEKKITLAPEERFVGLARRHAA